MDNVWSSLSQRVAAKLGRPLPELPPGDPADPGFLVLLNQLRQTDPDLAEAVINAYTGTCERLPSEAEAAAERQRQRMRQHFFKRFFRPDGLRTGRMRLNIRKIFNWIGATVALFIIVWSLIPKSSPVNSPASRVAQATSQAASQPRPPSTLSTIKSSSAPSTALSPEPPPIPLTRRPSPRLLTAAPPPGFPPPARRDSIGPVATPFSGPGGVLTPITRVIVFEANQPQPASFSPVVYQREESQAGAQQPSVVVYDASATQASAGSQAVVPAKPDASGETAAPRGQVLEARLVTPVAVTASGTATPALAEIAEGTLEGALLLGQATRSPEGLVLIQFSALITKDGGQQPFRGAAYDAGVGRMGVAGQASTMMPGAASALLAATMQAASDYFKARAQQQQVTITNGFLTVTQGPPSFWDGLAAAVARALAPNPQETTGPTVVTRLDRGQTITVLVM